AGLDEPAVSDYLDAVRSIVREMAAHGRGGILIISPEEHPRVGDSVTYKMVRDSSLAGLLRLVGRIGGKPESEPLISARPREATTHQTSGTGTKTPSGTGTKSPPFGHLLRNALRTEVERVIEEFGALTGIDGAILLNRDLALMAFGVILPVGGMTAVTEAV